MADDLAAKKGDIKGHPECLFLIPFFCSAVTVVGVEPASAHSTVLRKDAAMDQDGHACMARAATSRNSFSVAPLAD
jgi:hypothetical protein